MREPGRTAIGTWSGGRFLHFGEAIAEDRLVALLRPGDGIDTVLTADTYGQGEADTVLGRALGGVARDSYSLVGAVGHDFYEGERDGPRGFPRFTDPSLRGPDQYGAYLRMAAERSLERLGADRFDLLLLHNPDRTGYESEAVWDGMAALRDAGLTGLIGVAPGPANGFTLDLIGCLERFGERIDWAMVILNPFEPWPGELVLDAAERHGVGVITRVVDYGGHLLGRPASRAPSCRAATTARSGPRAGSRTPATAWSECGRSPRRRPDADADGLPVEPRPPGRAQRRPDADPGDRARGAADRGEARRARGAARRAAPLATRTSPRSAPSATTAAA